ncbi:MAG: adenosylcobinamide-GDP ribazoletransferase [Micropruina sp.]|uniref:adenosylcobinamide-GDP ribazoletransferase n=1 Tax=Micropruina sp. TaxID=2737536 RepID=UPI0039E2B0ED
MSTRTLDGWRLAVGTLTVFRVAPPQRVDRDTARTAALLAPVAFAPAAVLAAGAAGLLAMVVPGTVAALLAVGLVAWLTRAIHLDGLADTADGLGSGRPAPRALEIMRRGDVGPMGVVTLVVVLGLQVASAAVLLERGWGWLAVALALCAGRGALVIAARRGVPAARPDGLGTVFASSVPLAAGATLWAVLAVPLALGAWLAGASWWLGPLAAAVGAALAWYLVRAATRRLGGITGDVLGAAVEVATTGVLIVLAAG